MYLHRIMNHDIHMVCIIVTVYMFLFWELFYMGMGQNLQEQSIWGMNRSTVQKDLRSHTGTERFFASELVGLYPNPYVNSTYTHTSKYSVFDDLLVMYLHLFIYMSISRCLFTSLHIMDNYMSHIYIHIQNCIYTYPYIHIYIYIHVCIEYPYLYLII